MSAPYKNYLVEDLVGRPIVETDSLKVAMEAWLGLNGEADVYDMWTEDFMVFTQEHLLEAGRAVGLEQQVKTALQGPACCLVTKPEPG